VECKIVIFLPLAGGCPETEETTKSRRETVSGMYCYENKISASEKEKKGDGGGCLLCNGRAACSDGGSTIQEDRRRI
jgi:hypothetical protein